MSVTSRRQVLAAVERARALGGQDDEAIATAALALGLPAEAVRGVVDDAALPLTTETAVDETA